jgi:general secretion pathway protein A
MDKPETQAYVEHRLAHVGWKGDPKFGADALDLIHTISGGIPRRINLLCNRLMLAGFLGEKHAFNAADVQAIAREIREELGPEGASLAAVPSAARDAPVGAMPARAPDSAYLEHVRDIEERMDRLEKTVGTAVDLLHRLLHPERPTTKPGTPAKR